MKKKITKLIKSALPLLYDKEGKMISNTIIANKIYDAIPNPEKLELLPFEVYVPFACSGCFFNGTRTHGCMYDMVSEKVHRENTIPDNCPLGHRN